MSTQTHGHPSTTVSISTPFRSVRLLEVPPDLLDVITSSSSSSTALKFKSAPPLPLPSASSSSASGSTTATAAEKEGILHLCTADKTWAVKQVSTSNSVYLIQPTTALDGEVEEREMEMDVDGERAGAGAGAGAVSAVAQVGSFLELHPVVVDEAEVERAIVRLVPVQSTVGVGEEEDLDLLVANRAKGVVGWKGLVDDVAVPDEVVERVCRRLGVFEVDRDGSGVKGCWVPSARVVLEVWRKIVEGCAIEGIRLDGVISVVKVVNVLVDEIECAIADKMLEVGGVFESLGLFEEDERKLKPVPTCQFTAGLMLSSTAQGQMEVDEFLRKWTDLVPASFIKHCTVEVLTSTSTTFQTIGGSEGGEYVKWNNAAVSNEVVLVTALLPKSTRLDTGSGDGTPKKPAASVAVDKKRKWHEKFGAQRNTK